MAFITMELTTILLIIFTFFSCHLVLHKVCMIRNYLSQHLVTYVGILYHNYYGMSIWYWIFIKLLVTAACWYCWYCYLCRIGTVGEWLNDCEQFALQHAPNHPVLYYHLSLINALAKQLVKSRKNFNNYLSKYVCVCG